MGKLAVVGDIIDIKAIDGTDLIMQAVVFCGDAGQRSGVVIRALDSSSSFKVINLLYKN